MPADSEQTKQIAANGLAANSSIIAEDKVAAQSLAVVDSLTVQSKLNLRFNAVSYKLKQNNGKSAQILNETCGEFKSGRLSAILGPSGAGKTSMLNVLAGFKARGVSGNFALNTVPRELQSFRKMCSYIPQDFVMLDLLTVEETLKVSVDLKLPTTMPALDKQKIIDEIVTIFNMQKCRHTLVCNISGGERKRLSIGIELVTNPPMMFFDEPTSGLDSVASLQVMSYLRRLASDGRIIVCVVHQPSSRLMKLFDDVMVMSRGEVLYAGTQHDMLPYFAQSGFICPSYYNPADFVLEVGCETQNEKIAELIQRNRQRHAQFAMTQLELDESAALLPKHQEPVVHSMIDMMPPTTTSVSQPTNISIRPKEQVNFWRQFAVLMRRHFLSMSRNQMAVQLRIVMHIVVAALLGVVYWQLGNDAAKVLSNTSCLFFVILFIFSGNAMPSILLCQQDTAVFIREYLNGWYSVRAYYLSKMIADLPMQLVCPASFIGIVYYMTGQPSEWFRFGMCWAICQLTTIIGHFIGLVSGSTFDMHMSIFLVPAITIPFMLFSGFFIRINELAWFLRPICDISFFRYIMEGFMRTIYGYDRTDLECHEEFCYYKSAQKFLKDFNMLGDKVELDLLALLVCVLVLQVLFYLSLLLRIRRSI